MTVRNPKVVFSGSEVTGTTVTLKPDYVYDHSTQRFLIGEAQAGTTVSVILRVELDGVICTHTEAVLSGTSFAYNINGPLETIQFVKNGSGTLKLIAII